MTIDIEITEHCIMEIVDGSNTALGSLFMVSWNANSNQIIMEETYTKNSNPGRPSNGSSQITLRNLRVNDTYSVYVTKLGKD